MLKYCLSINIDRTRKSRPRLHFRLKSALPVANNCCTSLHPPKSSSRPPIDPSRAPPSSLSQFQDLDTLQASSKGPPCLQGQQLASHYDRRTREPPHPSAPRLTSSLTPLIFRMCHIENVHFSCGHPEDTKYTMCELAMSEMNHVTSTTQTSKTYPCAACFARGVEEKAKQTREQKGKNR